MINVLTKIKMEIFRSAIDNHWKQEFTDNHSVNKQMFVKHLPPARSEYRVPQRPITKTGTKEGQLTQRYY